MKTCESAQTDDCPGNHHPRSTSQADSFAQRSSRARGLIRGWIQTTWLQTALKNWVSPPKKFTKEANQQDESW